jgi:hypothetical protein
MMVMMMAITPSVKASSRPLCIAYFSPNGGGAPAQGKKSSPSA